jgi:S-adenosyl-L-methionine hydrolase (adenosine-forming)
MGALITLLTDFGTLDGYVGAMKGAILSRAPSAQLVDLTHDVAPQDVAGGARALRQAVPWFPPGSIHVAVVDPGVGTARRRVLVRSGGQLLVGPDNGLLSLVAGGDAEAWVLDRPELFADEVSATFEGRDVFASVAGHLAAGLRPEACGSPAGALVRLAEARPRFENDRLLRGQALHADRFGNLITNLRYTDLPAGGAGWRVVVVGRELGPIRRSFADVELGEWLAYWGSSGELELAVREGSAAAELGESLPVEVMLCR